MGKSYVHVYTGDGKGKTTAAFGLALRAALAGKPVYIGQFIKGMKYSEVGIEDILENITIEQFGQGCFINREPTNKDVEMGKEALLKCEEILKGGKYEVVILDEINIALYFKLFTVEEVLNILKKRDPGVEVILTGRYAPNKLIEFADLVTEMKEIKHYYTKGVLSREGIDV
ncbi:cob(I)yrinic acid a,c-diamide adenosyltransferase [Hathewaya massiliensis]|uniref:cob(I)yrinic acid a,c-diamide adenosyltransferase n=1 Tax=Hathewaya massiliensis TaxID=1964382 RepID=UPI001157E68B|nr:cob(I)yrinic acid a,c-diamide adenosyltransferase [Hathewaya massiliensis]